MVCAKLKWNKQKLDVELNGSGTVAEFKAAVLSLTGVPVERQKLTCPKSWKGQLTDDTDLSSCKLKDGMLIMLIGSADTMVAPTTKTVFIEDLPEEEKAAVSLPVGFRNLGNTCYMNSTLQCLRFVPELREGLRAFQADSGSAAAMNGNHMLTSALGRTFHDMDRTTQPYSPMEFWGTLKNIYAQFAEMGPGGPKQQDADELFMSTMTSLSQSLSKAHGLPDLGGASSLVDALFGMEMEMTDTCDEAPEEPPVVRQGSQHKLTCFIQGGGGSSAHVDHLHEGILLGLTEKLEKNSQVLGRDAVWSRTNRIKRLPRYVCVQFMRFYMKKSKVIEEGREVIKNEKCKIMRPVTFPEVLDVYNYCDDKIKSALKLNRDRHGDEILGDLKLAASSSADGGASGLSADTPPAPPSGSMAAAAEPTPMEGVEGAAAGEETTAMEEDEDAAALQAALELSMAGDGSGGAGGEGGGTAATSAAAAAADLPPSVGPGLQPDFQGNYELFGVVTHKGRLADGGHYIGWVRQDGDDWLVFDDADVSPCKTEDIMPLKGGGDYHMAYLAFYRYKN